MYSQCDIAAADPAFLGGEQHRAETHSRHLKARTDRALVRLVRIEGGVGQVPPRRGRTPAPRPNSTDYGYKLPVRSSILTGLIARYCHPG
jgi:hypothetical protein